MSSFSDNTSSNAFSINNIATERIAADFSQRVVVHSGSLEWTASPIPGVERKPLDRVGGEVARATSLVRYAAGSEFSAHVHSGGEEFIVLQGVFEDEHGSYPIGSYVRNPPQSKHQPSSKLGCIIFVKLWQFQPEDRVQLCLPNSLQTENIARFPCPNVTVTPLYEDAFEYVCLLTIPPHTETSIDVNGGAELFVLAGSLTQQNDNLVKHSWLRIPVRHAAKPEISIKAGHHGVQVWLKRGHLTDVQQQINRVSIAKTTL